MIINSTDTPIISFVIPVYNNHRLLPKAVNSILKQDNFDGVIEIIIVDDGSTDSTGVIADSLARKNKCIKVIHQSNKWIYGAMNRGVTESQGEYVYILNSDDLLCEGVVKLMIDNIREYSYPDVIWTKVLFCNVDEEQNILSSFEYNKNVDKELYFGDTSEVRKSWFYIQKTKLADNQANLYKRSIMNLHPFRTDIYGADKMFNMEISDTLEKVLILPDNIYQFNCYYKSGRNASVGKYYSYDHDMFNEMYSFAMGLYQKWGVMDIEISEYLIIQRLKQLTYEIKALGYSSCHLSIEKKIAEILKRYADPNIRKEARRNNREREYESRILNGLKTIICDNTIGDDYGFVKDLVSALPCDYNDNIDTTLCFRNPIKQAINHINNPDHIGKVYYSTNW